MSRKIIIRAAAALLAVTAANAAELSDTAWDAMKKQALERKREVLYNTDGCDALLYPADQPASRKGFLAIRLDFAKGTRIDSVLYSPISSGFGYLTSRTEVGDQLLKSNPARRDRYRNVVGELLALGTDPLKLAEEFCRENKFEFFASLRVNDTHDYAHRPEEDYHLFSPYKRKHPEFLMGSYDERPRYARWSAVDFTHREIRARFVAIIRELMTNYELDGLELDFCRHVQYFKSVAYGGVASAAECELMTDCLRQVRRLAGEIGRKRGRPILIAVRVPDSVPYAKAVGLDLETWMGEKLIDIYIGAFYLQLNPWRYSRALCDKYGVKFYPSLDECRFKTVDDAFSRRPVSAYRARTAAALAAGADGIYYFNLEKTHLRNFRGSMDDIRFDDKRYFISYRDHNPDAYLANGAKYRNLRMLHPQSPLHLAAGRPEKFILEFGDDLQRPEVAARRPELTAFVRTDAAPEQLTLAVNGQALKGTAAPDGKLLVYPVAPGLMKSGENTVVFTSKAAAAPGERPEKIILAGDRLLKMPDQLPWRRLTVRHDVPNSETIVDGACRLTDSGAGAAEMTNLVYPLSPLAGDGLEVAFSMRTVAASEPLAAMIRLADGRQVEVVTFAPGEVAFHHSGARVRFDTANFHDYRAVMKQGVLTLSADGKELLKAKLTAKAGDAAAAIPGLIESLPRVDEESIVIGSLSGPGTGTTEWKHLRLPFDAGRVEITDFKLELVFPKLSSLPDYRGALDWTVDFNVADGKIPAGGAVKRGYPRGDAEVREADGGRYLHLDHRRQGYFRLEPPGWDVAANRIVVVECRFRYLGDTEKQSGFCLVAAPAAPTGGAVFGALFFRNREITAPWGKIPLEIPLEGRFVTCRLVIDNAAESGTLYLDGKELASGRIKIREAAKPGLTFGDGSKAVEGAVDLEYVRTAAL